MIYESNKSGKILLKNQHRRSARYLFKIMSTTAKKSVKQQTVEDFVKTLEYPLKNVVKAIREVILSANADMTEHIKWNAPSFCFGGEDRITMNLRSNDFVLLIFHRGAKVKTDFVEINDPQNLLTWLSADRATAKFVNTDQVTFKKDALEKLINRWIEIA